MKRREAQIKGTVRLIFQPAEEGGAGGKRMVEEGVLKKFPPVKAAFGFHQWPFLPLGAIGGRPGPMLAATELFDILVSGVGGHAAMPHHAVDPIVAASHVVTALQSIASRETDPLSSAVVSVTMFHAGDATTSSPRARASAADPLPLLRRPQTSGTASTPSSKRRRTRTAATRPSLGRPTRTRRRRTTPTSGRGARPSPPPRPPRAPSA